MKKFILNSTYYIDENGFINLCLRPDDLEIKDLIASNFTLISKADIETQISDLKIEMTPIMFENFQEMENISLELRNSFEL